MDLRSLLVASDDGDRPPEKPAPPAPHAQSHSYPPQQQHHHHQQQPPQQQQGPPQTPTTPAQGGNTYAFRESAYSHALHASPGKPPAPQEYSIHSQPGSGPYPPQSPYQTPGPYPGRPSQPTLQTQYSNDPRSPGSAHVPGPSPYRQTPTPSTSGPSGGYPFPPSAQGAAPSHESIASPVQRHQYPPTSSYPPRDSYSHASGTPLSATAPPSHPGGPYPAHQQHQQQQSHHPVPQTPPVGTPGANHPFLHQRSQSTHSTPTPTSAQSQHPYGQPYPHGSPVAASHPPPGDYNRQASQPPTPLGPPLSTSQRQSSAAQSGFAQPPSPYQQRMSTASSGVHQPHATPPPPSHPGLQRASTSHISHDSRSHDPHRRSQSNSERDKSMSVSPKTRVPSLPSSAGGHPSAPPSVVDAEVRPTQPSMANILDMTDREHVTTPAKRKLRDRDLSPRELEKTEPRPPPGQVNGGHVPTHRPQVAQAAPAPVPIHQKKRQRRAETPVWAQQWNAREHRRLAKANFELQKRGPPGMNGKHENSVKQESRHGSPEASRPVKREPTENGPKANPKNIAEDLLGPWEPCINGGVKPFEEVSKAVADFIFINVVSNPDNGEIVNRGVQFEIEAKLGTLIDKDTNERVDKYVSTECVLQDTGRIAFRSSMSAAQHKGMNEWLNAKVVETNPQNPKARGRVQIRYEHRRELDKFYELPNAMQGRLPGCVRARFQPKHTVKVRVTQDQKSGTILNKIVKARVADLNLHMPNSPLDCRISINLEAAWDGPVEELEQLAIGHDNKFSDRNKDRLSYTQSHYQIDLTQVTQSVPGPSNTMRSEKEHELEVELSPVAALEQGRRALSGQPHRYGELVEAFVDNVRVLARASADYV